MFTSLTSGVPNPRGDYSLSITHNLDPTLGFTIFRYDKSKVLFVFFKWRCVMGPERYRVSVDRGLGQRPLLKITSE